MRLCLIILLLVSGSALAHRGAVVKKGPLAGCHQDRKQKNYHCHNHANLGNAIFKSEAEALARVKSVAKKEYQNATFSPAPQSRRYSRSDWKHWTDEDSNCLNTRHEILKERSLIPVTLNPRKCGVVSGQWRDFYFDQVMTNAAEVDIDHVVPLKVAHDSGGSEWDAATKRRFANDPDNLVITHNHTNRQKGPKDLTEWLPANRSYACTYVVRWMQIKKKYQLKVSDQELRTQTSLGCLQK